MSKVVMTPGNGKNTIKYEDSSHTYWLNDKAVPSVTQILQWKFRYKYAGVSEIILKNAATKGTELHNAIECYEKYGLERDDLQEFRDYKFLKQAFNIEITECEIPLCYVDGSVYADVYLGLPDDKAFCGRADLLGKVNGKNGLFDIKRTSVADKDYLFYQLNLYRLAVKQLYGIDIEVLGYFHLHEGKRKYAELPVNEELTVKLINEYWEARNEGNTDPES